MRARAVGLARPAGDARALAAQLRAALALDGAARGAAGARARAFVQADANVDVETARMSDELEAVVRARRGGS